MRVFPAVVCNRLLVDSWLECGANEPLSLSIIEPMFKKSFIGLLVKLSFSSLNSSLLTPVLNTLSAETSFASLEKLTYSYRFSS